MALGKGMMVLALGAVLCALGPGAAETCTTFALEDEGGQIWVGKSYDWSRGEGLVVFNPRGLRKHALVLAADEEGVRWEAAYASLTFNQYGYAFPNGGMNEAGLVVEVMVLDDSVYPAPDARPSLNELQWVQWALDNHADVAELVAAAPAVRVAKVYAGIHYLACDQGGACATFEWIDGALVIHHGESLDVRVLTNDPYAEACRARAPSGNVDPQAAPPPGTGSLARFARAAHGVRETVSDGGVAAFALLDAVRMPGYTQWQIVYTPALGRVQWQSTAAAERKEVRLAAFAPQCPAPAMVLDVDFPGAGDAAEHFEPFSHTANRALLGAVLGPLAAELPLGAVEILAAFPLTFGCASD